MKTTLGSHRLRIGAFLIISFLSAPISGASAVSPANHAAVVSAIDHGQGGVAPAARKDPERERPQRIALLDPVVGPEINQALRARSSASVGEEADTRSADDPMGLQLPEPGPLSAIIATLALAVFVMIRRIV